MDKRFLVILAIVVLALGGIFFIGRNKSSDTGSNNNTTGTMSNNVRGENAKKVNLTVYGDFQCPVCGQFFPIEKQVVDTYQKDIEFRFIHFPLESIHPNARAAARATEAAAKQGKFFEMHDLLYQNQSAWSSASDSFPIFASYAAQIGLNADTFKTDFASATINSTINADLKDGNSKGVTGTPTYYLNGVKLNNGDISSVEKFSAKVQEAINQSK
ncbi:MAG: thioredoxin domain-containing protein [Candidatus Saccharimonadales bacterium]